MKKKDASFWSDIKALDERLTKDPNSFCFARLSEIYLKVGLVADALHTARNGVAKHPGYLAGQRALGMACHASGLHDECRLVLERVTAATPEDVDAQKLLATLYVAAGDHVSAIRTYSTVLDFRPDDRGASAELETLHSGGSVAASACQESGQIETEPASLAEISGDDEIIELSESDIHEELSEEEPVVTFPAAAVVAPDHHDPLSTLTLAELYEQQGFLPKALAIYRSILADDPSNAQLLAKVAELEGDVPDSEELQEETVVAESDEESDFFEAEAYGVVPAPLEAQTIEPVSEQSVDDVEAELSVSESSEDLAAPLEFQIIEADSHLVATMVEPESFVSETIEHVPAPLEFKAFAPLAQQSADNVVDTLDGWLENIRRIKACR